LEEGEKMITVKGYIIMLIALMCLWACDCIYKAVKDARKVDWKWILSNFLLWVCSLHC